jgi:hypothetical protein
MQKQTILQGMLIITPYCRYYPASYIKCIDFIFYRMNTLLLEFRGDKKQAQADL